MNTNTAEQIILKPARLGPALKRGFADAWDRLGLVVGASIIWSLSAFVPIAAFSATRQMRMTLIGVVISWILSTPVLIGIFRMAHKILYRDDPSLGDILDGIHELGWSAYVLSAINLIVVAVLAADVTFFFGMLGHAKAPIVYLLIGLLSLYILMGWGISMLYQGPALAAQKRLSQRGGAVQAIKKGWLLFAGNPVFTIGLFVVILGFGILCALSVIGMLILYAGVVSILLTHALRELYIRYGVVEEPSEIEDHEWRVKSSS
jgi:hypothetical protein